MWLSLRFSAITGVSNRSQASLDPPMVKWLRSAWGPYLGTHIDQPKRVQNEVDENQKLELSRTCERGGYMYPPLPRCWWGFEPSPNLWGRTTHTLWG